MAILVFFCVLLVSAHFEHHEEIRSGVGLLIGEYYTPDFLRRFLD